jgi:hypothetical protein
MGRKVVRRSREWGVAGLWDCGGFMGVRCLRRVWGVTRSDDGYFGGGG